MQLITCAALRRVAEPDRKRPWFQRVVCRLVMILCVYEKRSSPHCGITALVALAFFTFEVEEGMGLSSCRLIIDARDRLFWDESEVGHGAALNFSLMISGQVPS